MTPTAVKLYQLAVSRRPSASIDLAVFQGLCGLDFDAVGWEQEVERACRELVSAGVVKRAYLHDGEIHLQ